MIDIIFEDSQLLVLNKPAGVPVQPDQTGDRSLLDMASTHCKRTLFLVHRTDRPVSGLLVLAKTKEAAALLQAGFASGDTEKWYLACVSGDLPAPEGDLVHYLAKDSQKRLTRAYAAPRAGAEKAVLHYRLLGSGIRYHLLLVRLQTGRFHQIRAQLAAMGCPVKGDVKYGSRRGNPDRSIHLHAWKLRVEHPFSGELLEFAAPLPVEDPVWKAMEPFCAGADQENSV